MAANIGTDSEPILVNVRVSGLMVDAIVRATDEATFIAAAKMAGLMYQLEETTVDPETGEATVVLLDEWVWTDGISIDTLGSVLVTPATYDELGEELTPAIMDERYHVNLRLMPPATLKLNDQGIERWKAWAQSWSVYGAVDAVNNSGESALVMLGVSLIDPDTISSPTRGWL